MSTASNGSRKKKSKGDDSKTDNSRLANSLNTSDILESDVSFDHPGKQEYVKQIAMLELRKEFETKLNLFKAEVNGKVEALHRVVNDKDKTIGLLQKEIGELKKTCDFLTDETNELKGQIKSNEIKLKSSAVRHNEIVDKASDLEDRSRRNNLLFFNIPETGENDDCEIKIKNLLDSLNFFGQEYDVPIDRAHRLGKKRNDTNTKPRPIIVRFTYYKDKEEIIRNGRKFRDSVVNVSEDFSKNTLEVRRKLLRHAKAAQETLACQNDQEKAIKHIKIAYKRVVLTYSTNKNNASAPVFVKSFDLKYIEANSKWFIPSQRTTYSQVLS